MIESLVVASILALSIIIIKDVVVAAFNKVKNKLVTIKTEQATEVVMDNHSSSKEEDLLRNQLKLNLVAMELNDPEMLQLQTDFLKKFIKNKSDSTESNKSN